MTVYAILITILFLWIIVLSAYLFFVYSHFRELTKGTNKGNLLKLLESILKEESLYKASIRDLQKDITKLQSLMRNDIQKIGLIRFNPFNEMGGDHSFAVAILDGHNNGFILTGLHTRERTRVYVKPVTNGKSSLELSKEETKALLEAQKQ